MVLRAQGQWAKIIFSHELRRSSGDFGKVGCDISALIRVWNKNKWNEQERWRISRKRWKTSVCKIDLIEEYTWTWTCVLIECNSSIYYANRKWHNIQKRYQYFSFKSLKFKSTEQIVKDEMAMMPCHSMLNT